MKTKLIIFASIVLIAAGLISFTYSGEKPNSKVAMLFSAFSDGDQEGFLIIYGDGSSEKNITILK